MTYKILFFAFVVFFAVSCQKKEVKSVKEFKPLNYEESLFYYSSYVVKGEITQIEETKRIVFYNEKVFALRLHVSSIFKGDQKYLGKDIFIDAYLNGGESNRYKKGMELTIALVDIDEQMRAYPFDNNLTATWESLGKVDNKIFENIKEIPYDKIMKFENIFSGFQSADVYYSEIIVLGQLLNISESEQNLLLSSTKDKLNYYTPYNLIEKFNVEKVIKGDKSLEGKTIYFFSRKNESEVAKILQAENLKSPKIEKTCLLGLKKIKKIEVTAPSEIKEHSEFYGAATQITYLNANLWPAYIVYLEEAKKGRIDIPEKVDESLH